MLTEAELGRYLSHSVSRCVAFIDYPVSVRFYLRNQFIDVNNTETFIG